ncbi:MAG TPA: hypothetical protein VHP36_06395 [Chitinispirillaceae bacterium]|nr:hypothetical protein [Chitinispirillaceae bacterium]
MKLLTKVQLSIPQKCLYLDNRQMRVSFFHAIGVSDIELDRLLSDGWRKFGIYYFRPHCQDCGKCIPVRVPVDTFHMSKSQRRLWRANSDVRMQFEYDAPFDELYKIYKEHSLNRFDTVASKTEFEYNFFIKSCRSGYTLYYLDGVLVAAGFLDLSSQALSSVYFIYLTEILPRGPGIYSILREIRLAADLGLKYYYLGYYVPGNSKMQYKAGFMPFEYYHWKRQCWEIVESREDREKLT